ncbi:hypothetical protein HPB50_000443 [Hyalomma asiaticum]|uniref:Uncharacterized protein n=1 Tax=Hyalomma asiaticum TaxID=266040 RepID=A0ACB7SIN5_HYAAI|nr:hypothetical protein HPB50_000443 [Hyalomma asiaticum]
MDKEKVPPACFLVLRSPRDSPASCSRHLNRPLCSDDKMKKAALGTTKERPSSAAQWRAPTAKGKADGEKARPSLAARVDDDYSPPCTRSQAERFATQVKIHAELEERRASFASQRAHGRSVLKGMENLHLGKDRGARQEDTADKGKSETSPVRKPFKVTKPSVKGGAEAPSASGEKQQEAFKKPKDKAAPRSKTKS